MTKHSFIEVLRNELKGLPPKEVDELLYDYEEHFRIGLENGRDVEEIALSLGNPKMIGRELRANYQIHIAKEDSSVSNVFKAMSATVGLGFFNLIFVLGPFIAAVGVIIGIASVSFALVIAGIGVFAMTFLQPLLAEYFQGYSNLWIYFFTGAGLITLGITFGYITKGISQVLSRLLIKYFNFNLNIIKNRK